MTKGALAQFLHHKHNGALASAQNSENTSSPVGPNQLLKKFIHTHLARSRLSIAGSCSAPLPAVAQMDMGRMG